jgi:hypothetical protein
LDAMNECSLLETTSPQRNRNIQTGSITYLFGSARSYFPMVPDIFFWIIQ